MKTLSERLWEALNRSGRKMATIARAAGISRATLEDILYDRCKRGPFLDTLTALARALSISAAWLAFGEGLPGRADLDLLLAPAPSSLPLAA